MKYGTIFGHANGSLHRFPAEQKEKEMSSLQAFSSRVRSSARTLDIKKNNQFLSIFADVFFCKIRENLRQSLNE